MAPCFNYLFDFVEWDGYRGVEEQMKALAIIGAILIEQDEAQQPVTEGIDGTSKTDVTAGTTARHRNILPKITIADTVEASVLTRALLIGITAMALWNFCVD